MDAPADKKPPVFSPALACTLWAGLVRYALLPRLGWPQPRSPQGTGDLQRLALLFALIFVGAALYQLVFRGWAREASPGERFLWTLAAPCAVVAVVLGIAGRF